MTKEFFQSLLETVTVQNTLGKGLLVKGMRIEDLQEIVELARKQIEQENEE